MQTKLSLLLTTTITATTARVPTPLSFCFCFYKHRIEQQQQRQYLTRKIAVETAALRNQQVARQTIMSEEEDYYDSGGGGGIMMILSPSKTLQLVSPEDKNKNNVPPIISDYVNNNSGMHYTKPNCCVDKTIEIATIMKQKSESELSKLLGGLSKKLSTTVKQYWDEFDIDTYQNNNNDSEKGIPCIFAFSGAAYQGLDVVSYCNDKNNNQNDIINAMQYMQQYLRILDPVYGTLRPLDMIQPYRLEMGTKNVFTDKNKNAIKLHDYWSSKITKSLYDDLASVRYSGKDYKNIENPSMNDMIRYNGVILLNLASDEYSITVNVNELPSYCRYVKVVFLNDNRNIAVHSKRARGLMVRYICTNQLTTVASIKLFNEEGYAFDDSATTDDDENTLVFRRRSGAAQKQTPTEPKESTKAAGKQKTAKKSSTKNAAVDDPTSTLKQSSSEENHKKRRTTKTTTKQAAPSEAADNVPTTTAPTASTPTRRRTRNSNRND